MSIPEQEKSATCYNCLAILKIFKELKTNIM